MFLDRGDVLGAWLPYPARKLWPPCRKSCGRKRGPAWHRHSLKTNGARIFLLEHAMPSFFFPRYFWFAVLPACLSSCCLVTAGNVTAAVQPKICPANAWLSLGSCVSGNQKATRCFGRGRTCWFRAELETKKNQKLDRFSQHKSWFFTSRSVFCTATLNTSLH